ncbi:MAG: leishmanolysin-related zinc metalloendopeptidase, partial [Longimicrobiaceae bacterium]
IGSLWASQGLLHNPVSGNGSAATDTYFSGVNGIAGFDAIGGATYTGGLKVPVENTGGSGTQNAHWRESVLKNELMTGYLNPGSNPLSLVTVRSLQDLGYTVNPGAADAFSLNLSLRGSITGTQGGLKLENDVYTGPRWSIDRRGRKTLLNP